MANNIVDQAGDLGLVDPRIIMPGNAERSVLAPADPGENIMTTKDYKPLTDAYKKVLKKEKLKEFYIHLLVYAVVNTALFIAYINSNPVVFWGCLLGWGAGVISIFIFKILTLDKQLETQRIEVESMAAKSQAI